MTHIRNSSDYKVLVVYGMNNAFKLYKYEACSTWQCRELGAKGLEFGSK